MVIDSSAILAILFGEPEAPRFLRDLASTERKLMSAVGHLESVIVAEARKGAVGAKSYASLVAQAGIEVVAFDASQAEVALDAWRRYGKGRHPAALNLGDCAAYALAAVANEELLFKGEDFANTDIAERPLED
jgi:ribonuclease VapC